MGSHVSPESTPIEACADDDGCCPSACNSGSDNDCSPSCGNGVIDPLETCDPPGSCPTSCDDGNACTTDTLTGSAANCSAACSSVAITMCVGGDGCCPAGCNATSDSDCSPSCGNGVVESGETCDPIGTCPSSCSDGNACTRDVLTGSAAMCNSMCSYPPISACTNNDGCCPSGCTAANDNDCDAPDPVCGDAICSPAQGELCTTCASDCNTTNNVCGNGACQTGETSANCRADCGPATWPAEWAQFEQAALEEMNRHRALGTDCPTTTQNPVPPLTMDPALRRAAQLHSWDQSYSSYFDHTSCNGRSPWTRAADQGTSANGETIGAGYSSAVSMINGWLNSQGHCAIMMSGRTHVGIGYAAENGRYWTAIYR